MHVYSIIFLFLMIRKRVKCLIYLNILFSKISTIINILSSIMLSAWKERFCWIQIWK